MRERLSRLALLPYPNNAPGTTSRAPHPRFAAADAVLGGEEFALFHVKAPFLRDLPLVEAGAAEGFTVGAGLTGGVEFDDVGHFLLFAV